MKYTHIIWDFNGTILDDVRIGIDAINSLLSRRAMKTIDSIEEYRSKFCFPIKEYYARCGFDFSVDDYERVLAPEWVREYNFLEKKAKLCDGVQEALKVFWDRGISQSIISASLSETLRYQTDRLKIRDYFENILGCDNFFAYGKTELCRKFVLDNSRHTFILVGDSTHDYDVAINSGIDCALISQGHMDRAALLRCDCPVFDNALEFSEYVLTR